MKNLNVVLLFVTACLISACGTSNGDSKADVADNVKSDTSLVAKTDEAKDADTSVAFFLKMAAIGGMTEIEASQKMLPLTTDPKIKSFAKMMVSDHDKANQALLALAKSKGFALPKVLPQAQIEKIKMIETMKEEGRNSYYSKFMLKEHNQAIDVFSQAGRLKDKEVADFANKTLPTLRAHYATIFKIDSVLLQPQLNQGDDPLKLSDRNKPKNGN